MIIIMIIVIAIFITIIRKHNNAIWNPTPRSYSKETSQLVSVGQRERRKDVAKKKKQDLS